MPVSTAVTLTLIPYRAPQKQTEKEKASERWGQKVTGEEAGYRDPVLQMDTK